MFQKVKQSFWFLILLICAISFMIVFACFEEVKECYRLIIVMPVLFAIVFLFGYRFIFNSDYKLTMILYFTTQFLRLVVMPAAIALAGVKVNTYLPIKNETIYWASILMIIEFLVVSLYTLVRGQRRIRKKRTEKPVLAGSRVAYAIFAMLAALLFVYFKSQGIQLVNFIALSAGEGERHGDSTSTLLSLSTQIVTLAVSFVFLTVVDRSHHKYTLYRKNGYCNQAIFAAMLVVCIIIGERRSAQIYSAFTTCYILILAFPDKKYRIITMVFSVALAIFAVMSVYKMFAAFLYDSYSAALENAQWSVADFAALLQSYFAGPENIALAMDFGDVSGLETKQALFDFARSTVPISFLMKPYGTVTSVQMNNYIYDGLQNSGHVLSGTGYGYIFGGVFLCWMPMFLNVTIAFFAEKQICTAKSYEGIYIWLTVMLRFALNFAANTPALISAATNYLFTAGIALGAAIVIRKVVSKNADSGCVVRHHGV